MKWEIIIENNTLITHSIGSPTPEKGSQSLMQCIIRCLCIFCGLIAEIGNSEYN